MRFLTDNSIPKAITLAEIQEATLTDKTLQKLIYVIQENSWHEICKLSADIEGINKQELKQFAKIRDELTVNKHRNLILAKLPFNREFRMELLNKQK